jgi:hypothetical protein
MVVVALVLLGASSAEARRKTRPTPKKVEPIDVAVLPFDVLRGNEARAASEALELELELVEGVRVQDAGAVSAELQAAKDPLDAATVKRAMVRRGLEALVSAPAGFERPWLVVFGADGKPRILKELPRGADADQLAATALAAIKPAVAGFAKLKAQKLPARGNGVALRDVVVDDDDDEDDGSAPTTQSGADDNDADARRRDKRRTAGLDDEGGDARRRRTALDGGDDDRLTDADGPRRTLADVDDASRSGSGPVKETHLLALSGTFDGAGWRYDFAGNDNVQPAPVTAGFHPGGAVRADLWPLPFVGIDASGAISTVQFKIADNENLSVTPNRFVSVHTNAGVSARGRYLLRLSDDGVVRVVGVGARMGYRFWNATAETQRIVGANRVLTVVPGFTMHALTVGPEVYVPLFVLDRRFEVELKLDTMPLTRYEEAPDNPGRNSLAFGYHAELLTRFDLFGGFFVELVGKSTGATINFEGEGDRITVLPENSEFVTLKGGRSLNVVGGFSVGVGFMY